MFPFHKIVTQFFMPLPLIMFAILFGIFRLWFTKKQLSGKFIVSLGFVLLVLLAYSQITYRIVGYLENKYDPAEIQLSSDIYNQEEEGFIPYIVVLEGGHSADSQLPVTSQISEKSMVRLVEGIRIYRRYRGSKLILSGGGGGGGVSAASLMANLAKDLGVSEHDIIIESESKDTKDEARMIQPIVKDEKFMLVTSAVHMHRSIAIFRKLGMNPVPAPVGHYSKDSEKSESYVFFPNSQNLLQAEGAAHEYLGMVWASLRGHI